MTVAPRRLLWRERTTLHVAYALGMFLFNAQFAVQTLLAFVLGDAEWTDAQMRYGMARDMLHAEAVVELRNRFSRLNITDDAEDVLLGRPAKQR